MSLLVIILSVGLASLCEYSGIKDPYIYWVLGAITGLVINKINN